MKYTEYIYLRESEFGKINAYLSGREYQGEDNTITYTAVFSDGMEMDIKCCGEDYESSWIEAVLIKNGSEVCFSDVLDKIDGKWELDYNGNRYCVVVSVKNEDRLKKLYRELEALSNLAPCMDDCTNEKNIMYSKIEELKISMENAGYMN